tara:strand:- start:4732 stop:5046 length:315 start_codon:yes stop_codon:yes gene_type:complete
MTEKPDLTITPQESDEYDIPYPPEGMPEYDESEAAHKHMMGKDPQYAIATHEHQLNKISSLIEELCARVISIEAKLNELENERFGHDPNNPINDYPEVQQHQNR